MLKVKQWDMVEIKWVDSVHSSGWLHDFEAENLVTDDGIDHCTIGYVFKETKKILSVVQSKTDCETEGHNIDALMQIPKVAIKKITKFHYPVKEKAVKKVEK